MNVPRMGYIRRPDSRAVAPVVGKTLEVGLVVLYLSAVSAVLFGGIVPDYRTGAASEVGDRTLAGAAERLGAAVPPNVMTVDVRRHVDLPRTIAGAGYAIRADGPSLVLSHPDPDVGGRVYLALPDHVVSVQGTWSSRKAAIIRIVSVQRGVAVRLESEPEG